VSVPAGFIDGGMPIGIHLFSGRLEEQKLLNIAYAFQEMSGLKLLNPFNER
jgi:Asp-tRNA(Asn)/Glu-tRNA(Gln) amidotransferase A subunit family amidase